MWTWIMRLLWRAACALTWGDGVYDIGPWWTVIVHDAGLDVARIDRWPLRSGQHMRARILVWEWRA